MHQRAIVAARIRENLANTPLPGPNGESLRVTVSIGVAVFAANGGNAHQLFERADQARYYSKQHGRNMTTVASVPPAAT